MKLSSQLAAEAPTGDLARASRVQSVDRAMSLLRAVADTPGTECTAALLAERTGLNRATAWRLLSTLERHGMVSCDRNTGQWSVGMGVIEVARSAGLDAMIRSAHKVLEHLSLVTGETTSLAVLGSNGLTYVDQVEPGVVAAADAPTWVGRPVTLHATSAGKALLAMSDPDDVARMVGPTLVGYTAETITDLPRLMVELQQVRELGYAECHGELESDAWGVSAPVMDGRRPVGVISVWGPYARVSRARFEALGTLTRDAADSLSRR